jgi:hypothetical protein
MYIDDEYEVKYTQLDLFEQGEKMGIKEYFEQKKKGEDTLGDIEKYHSNIDDIECPTISYIDRFLLDTKISLPCCNCDDTIDDCNNCLLSDQNNSNFHKIEKMRAILHYYDNQPSDSKQYDDKGIEI